MRRTDTKYILCEMHFAVLTSFNQGEKMSEKLEETSVVTTTPAFGSVQYQIDRMARNIEVDLKQDYIRERTIEAKFKQLQYAEERRQAIANLVIEMLGTDHVEQMRNAAIARQEMFKKPDVLGYLTNGKLKLAKRELLLVLGQTGKGKTTTGASFAAAAFEIGQKFLYLNNEQMAEDIYFKIAAAVASIPFLGVDRLEEKQLETLVKIIKDHLCHHVLVVDDEYGCVAGQTTTSIEGIRKCLEDLLKYNPFDVGLVDYFQQIDTSIEHPGVEGWKVQEWFAIELTKFRGKSEMPFIVLAQVREDDGKKSLKDRLEGRKIILNKADTVLELIVNKVSSQTCLYVHKCRSNSSLVGQSFPLIFDGSRYHPAKDEVIQ